MTWTALALTAAGTAAQAAGARKAQKAMTNAQAIESGRQGKLRQEADSLFNESLSEQGADSQKKRLADQVTERQEVVTAAQSKAPVVDVPVQGGAPTIVADETASRVSQGNVSAGREAALGAALGGYNDLQLGNALLNTRYGQGQANLSRFMRDSSDVLGFEMAAAARKGDKLKSVGQGLQVAGSLVGTAGAMGVNPFAASPASIASSVTAPSSQLLSPDAYYKLLTGGR